MPGWRRGPRCSFSVARTSSSPATSSAARSSSAGSTPRRGSRRSGRAGGVSPLIGAPSGASRPPLARTNHLIALVSVTSVYRCGSGRGKAQGVVMKAFLSSLALLVCGGLASANVTVSGQGKGVYVPDIGYVTVGVSSKGKTAQEAWEKNNAAVKKLFDALQAHGIDPKDIQTVGLNVSPEYAHPKDQEPVLVGYVVGYDLRVTVRRLDDMGTVLDDLVKNGANRNVGIAFGLANTEALMDEARLKAVQDARHKAELYATGAGANISEIGDAHDSPPVTS